ncbi:unnamed protein product [Brassicogethes aeneus]|uniref:Proto-oncogene tyrosine-protein kinase receptor Ret n=1 Tax=Brassicogethes aeneus TaxID=1431903 RepID=A0A9P0FI33_BRAAE|nr:unnamed protein product [Brassicogethes aeneus]
MFCYIFVLACSFLAYGNAAYFTIRNVEVKIPINNKLLPNNHPIITLYAQDNLSKSNGNSLRYFINETNGYMLAYSTKGDILFTHKFLDGKGSGTISAHVSVEGSDLVRDWSRFVVDVTPMDPFDCDLILESLCYWTNATYQIMEDQPSIVIGPLASAYVWEMCPEYKLQYRFRKENPYFELVSSNGLDKFWALKTTGPLNREIAGYKANLDVVCTVENEQGSIRELEKNIQVNILDVDNNMPVPQDTHYDFNLTSSMFKKGASIGEFVYFNDKDSLSVNNFKPKIVDPSYADILRPNCTNQKDKRNGKDSTICYCRFIFLKDKHFTESTYLINLQLDDTNYKGKKRQPAKALVSFNFKRSAANLKNHPRKLYPAKDVKVFRTAGPLARITQPTDLTGCGHFSLKTETKLNDIFNITKEGIVFVHDVANLRKAPEFVNLNISWIKNNKLDFDEVSIRIVEESSKSCEKMGTKISDWSYCSKSDNAHDCLRPNYCAIGTGGSASVKNRNNSERCMWRGDKNPGNEDTHVYATCTPDSSTCPDGICDSLEKQHRHICPQDCTRNALFPTSLSKSGYGIDKANGVCTCDDIGHCKCDPPRKKKKKTTAIPPVLPTKGNFVTSHIETSPGNAKHSIQIPVLAKCGTSCVLGIVAGTLFLVGAVSLVVICWRLDRVNKAVRGKYSDENQDMTAPLSDYVDRNNRSEIMNLNFQMTTSLAEITTRNVINKYPVDPKWEFPRSQLIIEQTLGEGEFGRVLRAKATNIAGQKGDTIVAVKTLKDDARESELNDLLSEYQLLKDVSHLNVIKLLGVCTVLGGPVYLIIEFAEFGSLRSYLRRTRHLKSENQKFPLSITGIEETTEIHYDEPNSCTVTPKEILSFAWQISNGMAYLSEIKLVHRDLAARNVLLTKDKVCKISDFGLTRDIYEDNAYFKRSKGRVPVKWMAPESLSDHVYTSKSDVWSFGILLWELVTLGATPYPGIAVQNLFHLIRQGYRMERPDNCSIALYKIIKSCWQNEPEKRPSFKELSKSWEIMLEDGNDYLDLGNNSIHNRGYFCSPFEQNEEDNDMSPTNNSTYNPLNYLKKSISYDKCGATEKIIDQNENDEIMNVENLMPNDPNDPNQNNTAKGYETPVKISLKTPELDQTGYTDMHSGQA